MVAAPPVAPAGEVLARQTAGAAAARIFLGHLAQQAPLGTETTFPPHRIPLIAALALAACIVACGDDNASPTPSQSPTASPTPTASLTPTPSPNPDFDTDEASAILKHLSADIGIRAGGTQGEQQAADYLRGQLASWGYEASEQAFPIQVYQPVLTTLEETTPVQRTFSPLPLINAGPGTAEGEIVVVPNLGEPADFPANTPGRIALIKRGTLTFNDKVQNAQAAGAIGVIVYNHSPGNVQAPLRVPSTMPAVTISQEEGEALVVAAQTGPVSVRMSIEANVSAGESHNVIGRAPGSDCRLLVGGHYDSVPAGPGANDNGSGTSVAMEIARVLATRGESAHVCFVLFGSEELGLLGSAYYASQLTADERNAIIGVMNFDMLGVGNEWPFIGSDVLTQLALQIATQNGISARIEAALPIGVGSDHASFVPFGIPVIVFNCFCDSNYHLPTDRFEFVKPARLEEAGKIGLGMIEALRPVS